MSGIGEASLVLGLVSSIITIFEAARDIYDSANDINGFPKKIRSAAKQISLVDRSLKQVSRNIVAKSITDETLESITPVLEQCMEKANNVKDIFDRTIPAKNASKIERFEKAMSITIKSGKVKEYMEEIFKNLQLLAQYQAFQDTETLEKINETIKQLKDTSDKEEQPQLAHFGTVSINANTIIGEQTIYSNSGSGTQYTAQSRYFGQEQERTNAQCLQHLRTTDPRDDKKRIEGAKGGLLPGSYCWILENIDYRRWRDNRQESMLWIKGDPGKGKTMLLCGIIDELRKPKDRSYLLSFFFCQATDSRINSATAVLRGLIYLLVQEQPSLLAHIREKYDQAGRELFEDTNAWVALREIFTKILQDPDVKETIVIVDALDECVTDKPQLLNLIGCQASAPRIKWIVSSRNRPEIEEGLHWAKRKVKLSLELNAESISVAVNHYISHQVGQLADVKEYNSETRESVRTYLSSKADNTFLWVALVCQNLKKAYGYNVIAKLEQFPPGLDSLYERMMNEIDDSDDRDLLRKMLALISVVRRPPTLEELGALAEIPDEWAGDLQMLANLIELCGSFLFLREKTIYFVHQSAKDFLLKTLPDRIFFNKPADIHYSIFSKSLATMYGTLQRDLYRLEAPGLPIEQVRQPLIDPLVAVRYSCVYWVDHLIEWLRNNPADERAILDKDGPLAAFFAQKFLYWLEALSLLGDISVGVHSIVRLQNTIKETRSADLSDVLRDASRFLQSHKSVIENYPFQAYASALVFSPTRSLVRERFKAERPSWLKFMPAIEESWSICLQTLEGHRHRVYSVVFSYNSRYLASASYDKTVRIWDTTDGKCLQTLEGHNDCVNSVVFSYNDTFLASGSEDGTIIIWIMTDGKYLQFQTLGKSYNSPVCSIAFSYNDVYLASGSRNGTVTIWHTTDWKYFQIPQGHSDKINSVVFSYNNRYLASASNDETIKIWNTTDGKFKCFQTLEGYDDSVYSIAFSHNDTYLASGTKGGNVRIWDTTSWTCLEEYLQTAKRYIYIIIFSIVFSHDDKYLALAMNDSTIKILDATNGTCLQTLKGHREMVLSVIFSHDGKYLASASWDTTVKIWDATDLTHRQTFESHGAQVESITFSYNGKYLVSSSRDETVKIWDATNGTCLQTLKGQCISTDKKFAFSHDDNYLASGLEDGTIIIWDMINRIYLQTLKGSGSYALSVVFSHNGRYLASALQNKTIQIWETTNGTFLRTLEAYNDQIVCIVFSSNDEYLASGLDNGTVLLWDTTHWTCLQILGDHSRYIASVAFSYDDKYLASGSGDETVKIWDTANGTCLQTLEDHSLPVRAVVFSQDSKYLASLSFDRTIMIWDTTNWTCLQTLHVGGSPSKIMFDQSGSFLQTEIGTFHLGNLSLPRNKQNPASHKEATLHRLGFNNDLKWISWNSENLLWLPPDYRPYCTSVTASAVAIGCHNGSVLILSCSDDMQAALEHNRNL